MQSFRLHFAVANHRKSYVYVAGIIFFKHTVMNFTVAWHVLCSTDNICIVTTDANLLGFTTRGWPFLAPIQAKSGKVKETSICTYEANTQAWALTWEVIFLDTHLDCSCKSCSYHCDQESSSTSTRPQSICKKQKQPFCLLKQAVAYNQGNCWATSGLNGCT